MTNTKFMETGYKIKIWNGSNIIQKITMVIVMVLLPGKIFSQYEKAISRLIYCGSGGEKGTTTYIYNGKKTPYKAIWELEDGSRWSVNLHKFDSNGNLISKHRDFSDSITIDQEYFYDKKNNLLKETYYRSDGVKGQVYYRYDDGKLILADCKGFNGWFYGKILYKYFSNSEILCSAKLIVDRDTVGTIKFNFDTHKRLIEETWSFNTGPSQSFIYEYINTENIYYKSSNVFIGDNYSWIIEEESYEFSGQGGGPSYYKYDKDGKLVEKTFVRSDGLKTLTNYYYRGNGQLEKSVRHYSDGKTGTFTYKYNKYGNLVSRDFKKSDGTTASEKYCYDSNGKLLSAKWVNFDSWLTGSLEFDHDKYDRITSAVFIGDKFNAEIKFTYDKYGNLTKYIWYLPNKNTQTYVFQYRRRISN